jgi:glycosyltransferase involved in cell wall biosynthesis
MEQKLNLSVILPIKSARVKDFSELFDKAITSLKTQKLPFNELIIVHTDEDTLVSAIESYDFGDINVKKLVWTETPNYAAQINYGVENTDSEWISFFEFDDEYSSIWFKNVQIYVNAYKDVDAFLPIVVDIDEKGVFAGFTNEATFAANFTSDIGILNNEILQNYQNFQSSGMVIKKSIFERFGKFKPSFKLTFVYEFMLRMTHNSIKIMSIPKIGYKHVNLREGSIFWNYKNGTEVMVPDEIKFWIDSAKKEYFFTVDRQIKYEPQTV